jgi:flagellar hook-associated protein 3 FlgL
MDTESMDPAEAITEMTWAQYCYNAALRIGTNILSQSLIDYLQ